MRFGIDPRQRLNPDYPMAFLRTLFFACLALFPLAVHAQREKLSPEDLEIVQKNWPTAKRSFTGLRSVVLKEGTGERVTTGDLVGVHYVGKLLDGTVFDKAEEGDKPFEFRVGRGQVIDGWEEGLQQMRVGEKRILIVPYELGYGSRGQPPKIPRRATLVFEVEVIKATK